MKLTIIALAALTAGCLMATDQSVISIESRDLGCSTDAGTATFLRAELVIRPVQPTRVSEH